MSSLQKQLAAIAADSSNQVDLRAQRTAHSKSLLFDAQIASDQDFYTIYQICYDGFAEMCALDHRFISFQSTLFSEQSIYTERLQLTIEEAEELNKVIESFMSLVGGRLLLRPAIKSIEWLIRRFRIHEYNIELCILTFLPYHDTELFATMLSILPNKLSSTYKFLHPYLASLTSPPRQGILHALSYNRNFFVAFNEWVLMVTQRGHHYATLLSFWASLTTESIGTMTDGTHSGRKVIRSSRVEDLLLLVLPVLNRGLSITEVAEVLQGCCMIISVLISRLELSDHFLDTLVEALLPHLMRSSQECALVCMSIVYQEKESMTMSSKVYAALSEVDDLENTLVRLSRRSEVTKLCLAYLSAFLKDPAIKHSHSKILIFFEANLFSKDQLNYFIQYALQKNADPKSQLDHQFQAIRELLYVLLENSNVCDATEDLLKNGGVDDEEIRRKLHGRYRDPEIKGTGDSMVVSSTQEASLSRTPVKQVSPSEFAGNFMANESYLTLSSANRYAWLLGIVKSTLSTPEWFDRTINALISKMLSEPVFEVSIASFLLRLSLSRVPDDFRVASFEALAGWFVLKPQRESVDMQIVLPYLIVHLSDKCKRMRLIAAQCVGLLNNIFSSQQDDSRKSKKQKIWGEDIIYGRKSQKLLRLSNNEVLKILATVILPHLEEIVLDRKHINRIIRVAIGGANRKREKSVHSPDIEMKSSLKSVFATFLSQHAANSYALSAKCQLFLMIKGTSKAIRHVRSEVLLPAIKDWASLNHEEVSHICEADGVTLTEVENAHLENIDCRESESADCLQYLLGERYGSNRSELREVAFQRLVILWPNGKFEKRDSIAKYLLDLSLNTRSDVSLEISRKLASETLRSLILPADILASFLALLHSLYEIIPKQAQNNKRKASEFEAKRAELTNEEAVSKLVKDYTFVIELVEASQPERYPFLLNGLFQCLDDIQNFRTVLQSEFPYLQGMALSCLRAIIECLKDGDFDYDSSVIRADLVADCVRSSSSPQVQNSAITLIASLASWMPELVLHAIMPIFTFMGNTVLRQSDDYSKYVIDQTMSKALPPLIVKLNKRNEDVVIGVSEIVISFTASFEHIPFQRRLGIFSKLIDALGADNSLFVIVIALLDRFPNNNEVRKFTTALIRSCGPVTALRAMVRYVEVLENICHDRSPVAEVYLHIHGRNEVEKTKLYENLINSLLMILSDYKIRTSFAKASRIPNEETFRTAFAQLLQYTIELSQNCPITIKPTVVSKLLPCIFSVLPLAEFLEPAGDLLLNSNTELQKNMLNCVGSIIYSCKVVDITSTKNVFKFLDQVLDLSNSSSDLTLRIAAVSCIDRIGSKLGRKDPNHLTIAASTIAKLPILNNADDRLKIVSLLCLASLVDVLREAFIPLSTQVLPIAISHFESSIKKETNSTELHDAAIALLSAILEHIPFILSIFDLNKVLHLIQVSASSVLSKRAGENRRLIYRLIVQNVDDGPCFTVIENSTRGATMAGYAPLIEHLDFVQGAVNQYSKPTIMKNSRHLQQSLLALLDLRYLRETEKLQDLYSDSSLEIAERKINNLAMSIIMKMNDKIFRPIFVQLVDWATTPSSEDRKAEECKMISFFKFYEVLNDQLKTIVTNYATYVIKTAQNALGPLPQQAATADLLRTTLLQGLTKNFEYDQDGFWQNPVHFNAIAKLLTLQLQICSAVTVETAVIPAIVSFAAAAASEYHFKELNLDLLKLMRSDETKDKLAAIKCEQCLTTRLGEDWLSLLPEMLPLISEMQEDDDEAVEQEIQKWIKQIENILGEKLDSMLQ